MDNSVLYYTIGVVIGMVVFFVWRNRRAESVGDGLLQIQAAAALAEQAVSAAEQLWIDGRLEKGERFEYVADFMRRSFPALSNEMLEILIEGAVLQLKSLLVGTSELLEIDERSAALSETIRFVPTVTAMKTSAEKMRAGLFLRAGVWSGWMRTSIQHSH